MMKVSDVGINDRQNKKVFFLHLCIKVCISGLPHFYRTFDSVTFVIVTRKGFQFEIKSALQNSTHNLFYLVTPLALLYEKIPRRSFCMRVRSLINNSASSQYYYSTNRIQNGNIEETQVRNL